MLWRLRLLQLTLILAFVVTAGRSIYLQLQPAQPVSKHRQGGGQALPPLRGEISDRNGELLAFDTVRYTLYLRPSLASSWSMAERQALSEAAELDPSSLNDLIASSSTFCRLSEDLTPAQAEAVGAMGLPGLSLELRNRRQYPHGELAAPLLGITDWQGAGQSGLERSQQGELAKPPTTKALRPAWQNPSSLADGTLGRRLVLTLDRALQQQVATALAAGIAEHQAKRATAIVLAPQTGEILAWSILPSFDPNDRQRMMPSALSNWAISEVYEPGSTLKVLTIATALEQQLIDAKRYQYQDQGELVVAGRRLRNHQYQASDYPRTIDLAGLLQHSSNTAAAELALAIGAADFVTQLRRFGLGQQTGIELPAESAGYLRPHQQWSELDLATSGFGQGAVAVTPLQLASAIAAIANDGKQLRPHLIKEHQLADGKKVRSPALSSRRVLSRSAARATKQAMAQGLAQAIAQEQQIAGAVAGVSIAGKTGTAQKYCPEQRGYCWGETIASFVGFLPVADPEYLILVVYDAPRGGGGWGNTVAGPTFNTIADWLVTNRLSTTQNQADPGENWWAKLSALTGDWQ